MRQKIAWTLLSVLGCASLGVAGLVLPRERDVKQELVGQRVRSFVEAFKPNERALVIVSGDGQTCLGLYVFDAQGNCVAIDDHSDPKTADDLLTEWIPMEQARYSIEVRNAGITLNDFQMAVR